MLSPNEVFVTTHKLKSGVTVKAVHRTTRLTVELDCHGSVPHPDDGPDTEYCNPNECADDLKAFVLEELAELVAQHYSHTI